MSWHEYLLVCLLLFYAIDTFFLICFALHSYFLIYLYRKDKDACIAAKDPLFRPIALRGPSRADVPFVTIQLPIYNEYYVVEDLLRSVTQIEWPAHKLEIQVLDDSTDETYAALKKLVRHYKKRGFSIQHLHRKQRYAYKAGALKAGLAVAKGEFIAVFDADFLPPRNFLRQSMPYFLHNEDIGMVQTRWGHTNADASFLTRAQALGIDGHFVIEQSARSNGALWLNFNGTAGIWRRACIIEAGNWQGDTLTEDLDLSYRAELAGWKFRYIHDLVNPAELPLSIAAFKQQQQRWCKGSLQTARKLCGRICRSAFPLKIRSEAILRLCRYAVHPLMLANLLLTMPILYLSSRSALKVQNIPISMFASLILFLAFAGFSSIFFYVYADQSQRFYKRLLRLPALMLIGSGIALSNSVAFFCGLP